MRRFRRGRIFLVLVSVACGHETFDLLPTDSGPLESSAGGGAATGAMEGGSGGAPDIADAGETPGGSGAQDGAGGEPPIPPLMGGTSGVAGSAGSAVAGAAGSAVAGSAGSATAAGGASSGNAGFGGEPDWGSGAGAPPDQQCDGGPLRSDCPPSVTMCIRCNPEQANPHQDCAGSPLPYCDPFLRHCVECLPSYGPEPSFCPQGEACYPPTMTCQPVCRDPSEGPPCPHQQPFCRAIDSKVSACVECVYPTDCAGKGDARVCARGTCVECVDDSHCNFDPYRPLCVDHRCSRCNDDCDCEPFEWCNRDSGACLLR